MSSTYLYGANVHANGIRQHYLRFGDSAETTPWVRALRYAP